MTDKETVALAEECLAILRASAKQQMTRDSIMAVIALRTEIQASAAIERLLMAGDIEAEFTGGEDGYVFDADLYVFKETTP